ncbi:hypothetical protein Pla163_17480 [Planctomycetes bacterium Pla163]|uniref:Septum formation initiator n=1 Tax=Rohdeia mirabilis TaxID=2528008 RepID=A0A518CZJ4_9BACT|nr:hypothetical protein Pla163_17480 [Planctomycetes bacterium Pla163]
MTPPRTTPTPRPSGTSAPGLRRALVGTATVVGDWLPIVGACGLLAHLSLLGLRPVLAEREFLEDRRVRIAEEHSELEADLRALERYERALDDPIFRERLRWQWRLSAGTSRAGEPDLEGTRAQDTRALDPAGGLERFETER